MAYISNSRPDSAFRTVGEMLRADAEAAGIPLRTLDQVRDTLARDKARSKKGKRIDLSMACLMLSAGRLTDDASAYVEAYLK